MVTTEIQKRKPQELGHFVEVFSRYIKDYRESSEQLGEASEQFGERLSKIDKDFSWNMPYAADYCYDDVVEFTRSGQSLTVKGIMTYSGKIQGFAGLHEAKE
ncbi:hypothetical protein GQ600_19357 [Phytophthora cactorum]|nr:hypothetical protein GQ600_19357 [Phytophthora cactorum]